MALRRRSTERASMSQERRFPLPVVFLIVAGLLICSCGGCCATTVGAGTFPVLIGQTPLIFWGQRTDATITAILPCATGVALSGNPAGFDFRIGESSAKASTIRVRYADAQGHAQTAQTAQTVACTSFDASVAVGDSLAVVVRPDAPQDILLDKDRGAYQTLSVATWAGALILLAVVIALLSALYALLLRPRPAGSGSGVIASPGAGQLPQQTIAYLAQQAIGPMSYPTRQIRLKEALLLLHLRQLSSAVDDDSPARRQAIQLQDHFILAAMLMELLRNGRITMRRGGLLRRSWRIEMLDPTPLGDPDTDAVLAELASTGGLRGGRLWRFYVWYGFMHHPTARLIDQLRRGGYVRLHVPMTGQFAQQRDTPLYQIGRIVTQWFTPLTFSTGYSVATDDYTQVLPWRYLDTTRTDAEERMFSRVQDAITLRAIPDDFTRDVLILVAAHYLPTNRFWRQVSALYNLYRFFPSAELRHIRDFLRQVAQQSPESQRALYQLVRELEGSQWDRHAL